MVLPMDGRRRQEDRCGSIDGRGGCVGSRFSIGHRGTFCQDFADDVLGAGAGAVGGAAAATGAASGWVAAVGDVLAAVRVDYIHDPPLAAESDREPCDDYLAAVIRAQQRKKQPDSRRMCVGFHKVCFKSLVLSL